MEKEIIKYEIESKLLQIKDNHLQSEYYYKESNELSHTLINRNKILQSDIYMLIEKLKES